MPVVECRIVVSSCHIGFSMLQFRFFFGPCYGSSYGFCRTCKNCTGFLCCLSDDDGYVGFDDTCFFTGDGCQGGAKEQLMVERNVGDDTQYGGYDVCAVQTTSKSYFNDGNIYMCVGKVFESHSRGKLKERRVERFEEIALIAYEIHYI